MSQEDTPDLAAPQVDKVAPEAVALRAQPRPVTRLNRRTLAILAGGLSVGVMGALIWSLQPQQRGAGESTELYNVDRVSKSEGLDALPTDYSKLPALPLWDANKVSSLEIKCHPEQSGSGLVRPLDPPMIAACKAAIREEISKVAIEINDLRFQVRMTLYSHGSGVFRPFEGRCEALG